MESPKDVFGHLQVKHSFLSTSEDTSAVLGPAPGSPVHERDALTGASPMQGHEGNEGSEATFRGGEAERAGAVPPRESRLGGTSQMCINI